jgi:hypothetical protein
MEGAGASEESIRERLVVVCVVVEKKYKYKTLADDSNTSNIF